MELTLYFLYYRKDIEEIVKNDEIRKEDEMYTASPTNLCMLLRKMEIENHLM